VTNEKLKMQNDKEKFTIFIDESGTLPDPKDKVVIVAAVGVDATEDLLDVNNKVRKKIKFLKRERGISEIKFYRAGERTKFFYLKKMAEKEIDIFALIVEKDKMKIADNPNNFAILTYFLIEECLLFYGKGQGIKESFLLKQKTSEPAQAPIRGLLVSLY